MGDRTHLELRALSAAELSLVAERAELALLEEQPAVEWAVLHPATRRLVISCSSPVPVRALTDVLDRVERELGVQGRPFDDHTRHPADAEPPSVDLVGMAADVVGVVAGAIARSIPLNPGQLLVQAAAVANIGGQLAPVRRAIEDVVGAPMAELVLGGAGAVLQGVTLGPLAPMVDLAQRVQRVAEANARRQAFRTREPELFENLLDDPGDLVTRRERAVPLPDGPIERFTATAMLGSALGAAGAFAWSRQPERATAALQAGLPRAASLGRESYLLRLGQHLAQSGVVVLAPDALRVLDRVDCLVVDASLLGPRGLDVVELGSAVRAAGIDVIVAGEYEGTLPRGVRHADDRPLDEQVRTEQEAGHVVLLVTAAPDSAIEVADLSVGLKARGGPVPWGAHLLGPDDPALALVLVRAAATARRVSSESATIAAVGASAAGVIAIGALTPMGSVRAPTATHVAAGFALVNGARRAAEVARAPLPARIDPTPWHALATRDVLNVLHSTSQGLSTLEAALRRVPEPEPPTLPAAFAKAVAGELINPLTPVLAGGAAVSAVLDSVFDAGMVASVVAANAVVGGVQQMRADRASARLMQRHDVDVLARRDGTFIPVHPVELVAGDVISLHAGEVVPADCRLLRAHALEVDESSLTGESLPVAKSAEATDAVAVADRTSMLYDATWVAAGEAVAVVVATGSETEARRALQLAGEAPETGVEHRLKAWTARTLPLSLGGGALVMLGGALRGQPWRHTVGTGVSLAVAAVPEGLPLLATVAELAAARRLAARNVLVRSPKSIEALGRVDVVCADKTGTLTEGRIVLQLVSDGREEAHPPALGDHLHRVLVTAVRATPAADDVALLPHPTDRAVAMGGLENGVNGTWVPHEVLPFEPRRSYHAVAGATDHGEVLAVKGAPEVVLQRCTHWRQGGKRQPLSDERRELEATVERLARRGLRILAVAEAPAPVGVLDDDAVRGLTFLEFVGLADPARDTAAEAVAMLQRAGISVMMITGDHPSTAWGIASELGLLNGAPVVTGPEIDACSAEEISDLVASATVFARVTPAHKVRLVRALQSRGHVVAMTGDGANDAPAIRLADVGIALGPRSTAAARSAADMVVLDERIETIVDAVVEGRGLWASVRDAVALLVGGNLGEIVFTVGTTLLTGQTALNVRQLLLVNLFTDAAPALAIAVRPPSHTSPDQLLHEGPDVSLGSALDRAIAWRAGATAGATMVAWVLGSLTGPPARARTIALLTLTGTQLGQTIVVGGRNPLVLAAGLGSSALLAALVQTPGISQALGCTPLDPAAWLVATSTSLGGTAAAVVLPRLAERVSLPGMSALAVS